jgi:hypothetical protein
MEQPDIDNAIFVDCEYCAECINIDIYMNHTRECRLLNNTAKGQYSPESLLYYDQLKAEKDELNRELESLNRERLIAYNSGNWDYSGFEAFIRARIVIADNKPGPGLIDPEHPKYSTLVYIWSVSEHFSCEICMQDNYTIYRKLECGHRMCNSCYLAWFREHVSCPFCRFCLAVLPSTN